MCHILKIPSKCRFRTEFIERAKCELLTSMIILCFFFSTNLINIVIKPYEYDIQYMTIQTKHSSQSKTFVFYRRVLTSVTQTFSVTSIFAMFVERLKGDTGKILISSFWFFIHYSVNVLKINALSGHRKQNFSSY
jgi:hypothetical protein